jgi:beta-phosphoglucomutase
MENVKAVIFDLDGVIVSTDDCHYRAWQRMADEEGIYFDRAINERLRGVSRMESLAIILERASKTYTDDEKVQMATRKNSYYRVLIEELTPADILAGVMEMLEGLKRHGVKIAIASSSKNSPVILKQIGLDSYFDATADGNDISKSKPDPEVFLLAAARVGFTPDACLVVEDADAGIAGACAGGMRSLGVGSAATCPEATITAADLSAISADELLAGTLVG